MSKVLVTGSREWTNEEIIRRALSSLPAGSIIVHGACPHGADAIADRVAVSLGFEVRRYPARWGTYRRGYDGNYRNQRMIDEEHFREEPIDRCFAFPKNMIQHGGTMDCINRAKEAGIPTYPFCKTCGRIIAKDLDEWDDSPDLLCFGDASCVPSSKVSDGND